MRVTIVAIGRLKAGPERDLATRYLDRAVKAGGRLALDFNIRELPEGRGGSAAARKDEEAAAILGTVADGALLVALDEHGENLTSRNFAERLGQWRDAGTARVVLAVGGPDGHGSAVLDSAAHRLSFGPMTWPHQLFRLMLAEQIYRAVAILSRHPYHRD